MSLIVETVIVSELARAVRTRNFAKISLIALLSTIVSLIVYLGSEIKASPSPRPAPASVPTTEPPPAPRTAFVQSNSFDIPLTALLISAGVFVFGSIGTASGVILGWRKENREAEEHRLKIEKLELELAEARRKLSEA